ncbi:uncharacterized protein BDZ99DRAFT_466297 [Mytilinidion resinicola]|uniref:Uncharacterized protein n=1 Tax=Mytilinidion resinicola TaxID=574789 RepID=A0A6A6YB13_9PEZI|nr:uncharacterized protein BDZ99DRAFT_466297 [Mytilinidion resinicola]KAF2806002.1 hypothetical protein BDZ99DRAFT_466297 [Mytilinidion resinicola]
MQNQDPNHQRPLRDAGTEQGPPPNQTLRSIQAAHPLGPRQRSEESWIEVSSQPSSSSLSSAADEIITTGLRVRHDSNARRRRRSHGANPLRLGGLYHASGGGSSQEEYDESESESDRVMSSSNEAIRPSPLHQHQETRRSTRAVFLTTSSDFSEREGDDEEDDDDENSTAVNYPRATGGSRFTPQPNAFSHPPTTQATRSEAATTYFSQSRTPNRPTPHRNAYSSPQHTPYNVISPSHQADHDAALRASLSTLLSAAAAVRGLPKPVQPSAHRTAGGARVDPSSLRLVSESVAMGGEPSKTEQSSPASSPSRDSNSDKYKRKATPPSGTRSSSKDRRAVKKARKTGPMMDEISPTLLTWVVSAGVVVLVSAISFSAGYVVGREAGHAEAVGQLGSVGADAGRCGREAASGMKGTGMGLRRLRWSSAPVRV